MTYPRQCTYKLFIGRAGRGADHERLVQLLDARADFRWVDLTPASGATAYEVRRRMRAADALVLLAANESAGSGELELARQLGRPIIGVATRGDRAVPTSVRRIADEVVGWNAELMIDSIRQYALPA